jgi:hypothetical protein
MRMKMIWLRRWITLSIVLPMAATAAPALAGGADILPGTTLSWIEQRVSADDGVDTGHFGVSVAIDGNTALIGAEIATVDGIAQRGAAYVFTLGDGVWRQSAKLVATDGVALDFFGHTVALDGDTALVAAYVSPVGGRSGQGAVYAFKRDGDGHWTQTAKLVAGDGASGDIFGASLALQGNVAIIGASQATIAGNALQGAAYVFTADADGHWSEQQKLVASDGAGFDQFGWSAALDGNRAIVSAAVATVDGVFRQGAAYVFTSDADGHWSETTKLTASDGEANNAFGTGVALQGDTALIGAQWATVDGLANRGAAYVFRSDADGHWAEAQKLVAANGLFNDQFGNAVALDGDLAVIGAWFANFPGHDLEGAAYVFTSDSDGHWSELEDLRASDGGACNEYGVSVAVSGNIALVGSHYATERNVYQQGAAYFYGDLVRTDPIFLGSFETAPGPNC